VRDLTRLRKAQINERARSIQRLEKVLQDAGIKLTSVASHTYSKSARAMLEALLSGVTDPEQLAELAKSRMRAKIPRLREALASRFTSPARLASSSSRLAVARRQRLSVQLRVLGLEVDRKPVPAQRVAAYRADRRHHQASRCSTRRRLVKRTNYRDFRHRGGAHDTTALRAERPRARPCALPLGTKCERRHRTATRCRSRARSGSVSRPDGALHQRKTLHTRGACRTPSDFRRVRSAHSHPPSR